jgi:phosphatidylglycerol lysyltransferase
MGERLRRILPAAIGLALFLAALEVLRRELAAASWAEITADLHALSAEQIALALILTALNYAVLTGYDFLAFASIGRRLDRWRIAIASFLAYAIANNVGFAMLSGAAVRYRFYARWGVSGEELSRIVVSYSITFWLGLHALGGLSLAFAPLGDAFRSPVTWFLRGIGWLLFGLSLLYVAVAAIRRRPIRVGRFEWSFPSPRLAASQLIVSSVDWILAGAVLFVLLPQGQAPFIAVLGAFLLAQLIGLTSHVPGGAGVFEGLVVLLLKPYLTAEQVLPSLLVYRLVYYLLPLTIGLTGLLLDELRQRHREAFGALGAVRMAGALAPRVMAALTFIAGVILLASGATPAAEGRLQWLDRFVPLGIVEMSHFVGSLVGVGLLLLSQGLARRLDAAYYLATIALGIGAVASLLKGADVEEAVILTVIILLLRTARSAFDRRAALLDTRFSPEWITTVAAVVAASTWLGFFAFKHVEYSNALWWQFELSAEAPRFLRASVGVAVCVLLVATSRLLGHAPHVIDPPTDEELAAAGRVLQLQESTVPYLVYLRDKALLFDQSRNGFVMYAVQGRTWTAMGDPVGPRELIPVLLRAYLERCADYGGTPAFYEVRSEYLHYYADFGLSFVKLGEEARVHLPDFSWEGGHASRFRQALRRPKKEGASFRVVSNGELPRVMPQLREVSDDWLRGRGHSEKGFSLGFFDEDYLSRFPVAIIEREGHIQAFANIWLGPGHHELSLDLMRHHHDAPNMMESLIVHLIQYGQREGYQWFSLGMAPMSGFEHSTVAPLWARAGSFLYEHGERMYNFRGLRAFKEKFNPIWEPRYLAYPGGPVLPRVLADIAALIAGGYRRVLS